MSTESLTPRNKFLKCREIMVVGEVIQAERVPGADKLLRLAVEIGDEKRNLVAGMAQEYPPKT